MTTALPVVASVPREDRRLPCHRSGDGRVHTVVVCIHPAARLRPDAHVARVCFGDEVMVEKIVEMLRGRVGTAFDDEATFTAEEVEEIVAALQSAADTPPPSSHVAAETVTIPLAEYEALRDALKPFAKYAGDLSIPKRRFFLQLLVCPEGDDHPENYGPHFQRALAALAATATEEGR